MAWMTAPESELDLFKGRHFDREVIVLCVRWYLSFKLSARDLGKCCKLATEHVKRP
jgi:hypothetical protein